MPSSKFSRYGIGQSECLLWRQKCIDSHKSCQLCIECGCCVRWRHCEDLPDCPCRQRHQCLFGALQQHCLCWGTREQLCRSGKQYPNHEIRWEVLLTQSSCWNERYQTPTAPNSQKKTSKTNESCCGLQGDIKFKWITLTLSLLRVTNVKIPLQPHKKYDITQHGELDFS